MFLIFILKKGSEKNLKLIFSNDFGLGASEKLPYHVSRKLMLYHEEFWRLSGFFSFFNLSLSAILRLEVSKRRWKGCRTGHKIRQPDTTIFHLKGRLLSSMLKAIMRVPFLCKEVISLHYGKPQRCHHLYSKNSIYFSNVCFTFSEFLSMGINIKHLSPKMADLSAVFF